MRPSYFLFSLFGTLAAAHAKGVGSNAATDANKGVTPEYELHCGPFTEGCRSFCGCTKDGKLACHPQLAPERCSRSCQCRASLPTGIKP